MVSSSIAYALWLFLGFLGVHHFYLGRDRHAFVTWATLGGVFGLGWLRDFFQLNAYIDECKEIGECEENDESKENDKRARNNTDIQQQHSRRDKKPKVSCKENDECKENEECKEDDECKENDDFEENYIDQQQQQQSCRDKKPKVSWARFGGMIIMGINFGYLMQIACPPEWHKLQGILGIGVRFVLPSVAAAVGVHLVANIGRLQASMKWPLIGAAVGVLWLSADAGNIGMVSLCASAATCWFGVSWKPIIRKRGGICKRVSMLVLFGSIYLLLWGSSIYFNAKFVSRDGEEVPLRVAINNFFKSPAWTETKQAFWHVWEHVRVNGWQQLYRELLQAMDPEGEAHAYKVLGLDESASQEDIKVQYRKLAKEWHPDKQQDPAKKGEAQAKFIEIKDAYDTLSSIKAKRMKQSKKSTTAQQHTEF